ncbi:MAG: helix-turn-helix domain-containing protein [Clostridia bacterium]|nr:helix-turn-helix domain-containing protein [Clostridia bacterium]
MTVTKAISKIMKEQKCTQRTMAMALGMKRASDVGSRLSYDNLSFDKAVEMLNVLGYEVVFQPVTGGHRKEGSVVVNQVREGE